MTIVTGGGAGNEMAWDVLSGVFTIVSYSDTGFNVRSMSGDLTVVGSGLTYSVTDQPGGVQLIAITAGTITGVTLGTGATQNSWSGFGSVSAVTAFNKISNNDKAGFFNLFFGGNDTFNISFSANPGMFGFDGDDTFNVSAMGSGAIDGGNGNNDTLNLSSGVFGTFDDPGIFNVTNVETINLAAGFDYFLGIIGLVSSGNSTTIDGRSLGSGNKLTLDSSTGAFFSGLTINTITGNLTVLGGAGDDFFQGGSGSNIFNGGGGTDTVSFHLSRDFRYSGTAGVTANLSLTGSQALGGPIGGTATFISIENLIGTRYDDTLTGNAGANILNGDGGGNDIFNGMGGNDTLIGGPGNDIAIFSGPLSAYTITHGSTTTISGPDGTDALTGIDYAQFSDQTVQLSGITLTTSNVSATAHGQFLLLPSLITSTSDIEGLPVQSYQLWESDTDPAAGHWVVNSTPQAPRTVITVASYDSVYFVAGNINAHLQIRAFDGNHWSAGDNAPWAPFTVSVPANHAPQVTTANVIERQGQSVALTSLVSVADADSDNMVSYQIFDGNTDPNSGYFYYNGAVVPARTVLTVSSLSFVNYVAGTTGDTLQVRAFDGVAWSAADNAPWAPFTVTVPVNHAPVVTTSDVADPLHGDSIAFNTLITATDPDGDTPTKYQIFDGNADPSSGHFELYGTVLDARKVYEFTRDVFNDVKFVTGGVSDTLQVRAFDGIAWSAPDNGAWAPFTVSVPVNHTPVVSTTPLVVTHNQVLDSSSLATITDIDGDHMVKYQIFDGSADPNSGHFLLNGFSILPARTVVDLTPLDFSHLQFVAGTSVSDTLQIRAYDGAAWSAPDNGAWSPFTVSFPANHAPLVGTGNVTAAHNQSLSLNSLVVATDPDGDTITKYQLWDGNADPASGHFMEDGIFQFAARTVIDVNASDWSRFSFVAGGVNDTLQVRAFDGAAWSAPDSGSWAPFTVSVPPNNPPIVTTSNVTLAHGTTVAFSPTLFSATDPDGDTIQSYEIWDATTDPNSGFVLFQGSPQAARTVFSISADQLGSLSFQAGSSVGDDIQIRAFDGSAWSAGNNAPWAPFHISVS